MAHDYAADARSNSGRARKFIFHRRRRARGRALYRRRNFLRAALRRARLECNRENSSRRRSILGSARVRSRTPGHISRPALDQSTRARVGFVTALCVTIVATWAIKCADLPGTHEENHTLML